MLVAQLRTIPLFESGFFRRFKTRLQTEKGMSSNRFYFCAIRYVFGNSRYQHVAKVIVQCHESCMSSDAISIAAIVVESLQTADTKEVEILSTVLHSTALSVTYSPNCSDMICF
jgi:hypothetical protein